MQYTHTHTHTHTNIYIYIYIFYLSTCNTLYNENNCTYAICIVGPLPIVEKYRNCKVEFIQPSNWLYSVPNLLVIQHLVTLYLGGFVVRVVSEIEY